MKELNLENVQEVQEYKKLIPGGYICIIKEVEDVSEKEYLKIDFDIAEGEFKDYYSRLFRNKGFWGGNYYISYKESALSLFKGFITSVEKSNANYKWDNDEKKLIGKNFGLILGEEEYQSYVDGSIRTALRAKRAVSVDRIKKGDYEVPPKKIIESRQSNSKPPVENFILDDDVPF